MYPELPMLPAVASGTPTLNVIHHCDALTLLRALPDGSVDCVVTSPPYNMRNDVHADLRARTNMSPASNWNRSALLLDGYEEHDDNMPTPEYTAWQRDVLTECYRVIKPTGVIFYNHKWRIQNSLLDMRNAIVEGFPVRQVIIWDRGMGNNFNRRFFVPQYEVIYMIPKPDFFVARRAVSYGDIWHISPEYDNPHPAPFPLEIPRRCIEAGCPAGGVVLDPFIGSGTTAVAAVATRRHYIGCDSSLEYVKQARERLVQSDPYLDRPMIPGLVQKSMFQGLSV